jgi:hypothetical protein
MHAMRGMQGGGGDGPDAERSVALVALVTRSETNVSKRPRLNGRIQTAKPRPSDDAVTSEG